MTAPSLSHLVPLPPEEARAQLVELLGADDADRRFTQMPPDVEWHRGELATAALPVQQHVYHESWDELSGGAGTVEATAARVGADNPQVSDHEDAISILDLAAHWSVHYGEDDAIAFVIGSIRRDLEHLAVRALS